MASRPSRWLLLGVLTLAPGRPGNAQEPDAIRFGGRFFPSIASREDSAQRYALLLPPGYAPGRRWPIVFLLDPRGRALVPLDRFGPAAMRLGFVVMSSYNTRSDVADDPNTAALNAMMADAQRALAVDTGRFYLAGFSGTARVSWAFATELRHAVRGIVSVGAGPPPGPRDWLAPFVKDRRFAVFAAAGRRDFNRDEMVRLDREAGERRVTLRLEIFDGGHEWLPTDMAGRALAWFDDRDAPARATDPAVRDSQVVARVAEILERAGAGDTVEAARRLASLRREHGKDKRVRAALADPAIERIATRGAAALEAERERLEADSLWVARARDLLRRYGHPDGPESPEAVDQVLRLADLRDLRSQRSLEDRSSALRRLEWLAGTTGFYEARDRLDRGDLPGARFFLGVSRLIHPLGGETCQLARKAMAGPDDPGFPECRPGTSP